ncbi:MAG TPA: class F sortase [Nitriliruptoraceae bacterium]|nr:class F sortase [Nitriliruptoraceae bacterium]
MKTRTTRPRRIMAAVAVLAMAAGACGSPAGDDRVASAPSTQDAGEAPATPESSATMTPGLAGSTATPAPPVPSTASTTPDEPSPTPTATPTPKPVITPQLPTGVADPVRLEIPSIGVDADLVDLSLGNGDPEVPDAWEDAGWYSTTRNPGEIGPAVIAGHIDSKEGPAVFFRLDELGEGDEVVVHGADGSTVTFVVTGSGQYPKTELPDEVFGFGQPQPELRLITCGGSFDSAAGHYVDNLVVYTTVA